VTPIWSTGGHSFHDGSANPENVATDTRVNRVLVSRELIYRGVDWMIVRWIDIPG
jgi:hypothetical protein